MRADDGELAGSFVCFYPFFTFHFSVSIFHSPFAIRHSLLAMFHREADTNNGNVIELGFCAAKEMDFP
jgi:hypothetical protein